MKRKEKQNRKQMFIYFAHTRIGLQLKRDNVLASVLVALIEGNGRVVFVHER